MYQRVIVWPLTEVAKWIVKSEKWKAANYCMNALHWNTPHSIYSIDSHCYRSPDVRVILNNGTMALNGSQRVDQLRPLMPDVCIHK